MSDQNGTASFLPFASIIAFVISYGPAWLTLDSSQITPTGGDAVIAFHGSMKISIDAFSGTLAVGPLTMPIWLIITLGIIGVVMSIPQVRAATSAPRFLSIAVVGFVAGFLAVNGVSLIAEGVMPNFGYLFAIAATVMGLIHAIRSPQETAVAATE